MLLLLKKSFVAEHLRYLKNGKSVKVSAHYTKRIKKHTEHALAHSHNLDHLSDEDKDRFNRMHAEQHVAEFYDGHALRKRVAHHESEAKKHNDHAAKLDKDGSHKEAAAARRKADKHTVAMHRHKAELKKVDEAIHGIAALKERLVVGSGKLAGDADAIHGHYVSKIGERLKPLAAPEAVAPKPSMPRGSLRRRPQAAPDATKEETPAPPVLFVAPKPEPVAAPASHIPANAVVAGVRSFTVTKVGRKWLEVSMGAKGYKTKLAISPETKGYEVGGQYSAGLMKVEKTSKYGSSTEFYVAPAGSEGAPEVIKDTKNRAEIERWLGYVEDKAKDGWLYSNGLDRLRQLGAKDYPEYNARLEAAKEQAKQVKAAQQAAWAKERAAKDAERAAKRQEVAASRMLYPVSSAPPLGVATKLGGSGRWVVFQKEGTRFNIGADDPSIHGSHLLGREGERGAYYYFRDAKPEEIAAPQNVADAPEVAGLDALERQLDEAKKEYDRHQRFFNEGGYGYNPHAEKLSRLKNLVFQARMANRKNVNTSALDQYFDPEEVKKIVEAWKDAKTQRQMVAAAESLPRNMQPSDDVIDDYLKDNPDHPAAKVAKQSNLVSSLAKKLEAAGAKLWWSPKAGSRIYLNDNTHRFVDAYYDEPSQKYHGAPHLIEKLKGMIGDYLQAKIELEKLKT